MRTVRLTTAQALVRYLTAQRVERDGAVRPLFGGCLGIFGHGNLGGIGQALQEHPELRYTLFRNEQGMVHAAAAYAKTLNRLGVLACTSSVGPGATNMVTGAAAATVNRLPVLLLPGDVFARRNVGPVLQQLESERSLDVSVNDCLRPVSRYWDRVSRPEQLVYALPEAMRVLVSPADTGAVTLALPQDVQAEAHEFPAGLFEERVWHVPRQRGDRGAIGRAAELVRASRRPLVVAGGGVIYSEATDSLRRFVEATGIPVGETQAGRGALPWDHELSLGAIGVTGTSAANLVARDADLVLGLGTRYSDFTTASKTAFAAPAVRFVNVNVAELDAAKHGGVSVVADAREALDELALALRGHRVEASYSERLAALRADWLAEAERLVRPGGGALPSQAEVLGVLGEHMGPRDVVVNAAGSAPGDLHKLFRPRDPKSYHLEYGYSTMGYEIPGAIGVKMAAPDRGVYAVVGDGTYLMAPGEVATAVQEGLDLVLVVVDNHGFASIGALSGSMGSAGFGTEYRARTASGRLDGERLRVDFADNAASLGARAERVASLEALRAALAAAREAGGVQAIVIETDREAKVPGYETFWDVPVAEVSTMESVRRARDEHERGRARERCFHGEGER